MRRLLHAAKTLANHLISRLPAKLQPMARWRFIKFGLVGASGTVINLAVLYVCQEFVLVQIANFNTRLNFSIALAISVATVSNFYWNRRLTWRDRLHGGHRSTYMLFLKYVMAAGLSIAIQSVLTKVLAGHLHYLLANLVAIALASVFNFVANDRLTFARRAAPRLPDSTP